MSAKTVTFHWKLSALVKPNDGQDCLVYNPCDGYRVAEWSATDGVFLEHEEPIPEAMAVFWMELPDVRTMCEMEQRIACCPVSVTQVHEREQPAILRTP